MTTLELNSLVKLQLLFFDTSIRYVISLLVLGLPAAALSANPVSGPKEVTFKPSKWEQYAPVQWQPRDFYPRS